VFQALASPRLEIKDTTVEALGDETFRVSAHIANTGWLPTQVTAKASKNDRVRPIVAELVVDPDAGERVQFVGAPARQEAGQLAGGSAARFSHGNDGTPDRTVVTWVVRCPRGTELIVTVRHDRAGQGSTVVHAT